LLIIALIYANIDIIFIQKFFSRISKSIIQAKGYCCEEQVLFAQSFTISYSFISIGNE